MTNRKHFPDHNVALTIRSPLEVSRANRGDFFQLKWMNQCGLEQINDSYSQ